MVCSSHLKVKYVRFLIQYHLFILLSLFIMTSLSVGFVIYKHNQIDIQHLLRGFLAHGTKTSDDYRKLIALIRQTQITNLYPYTPNNEIYQQKPYPSFNPHINPCTKRFYLPTCPILTYTELTLEFPFNQTNLFNDLNTLKAICRFEFLLKTTYTNCSTNQSCCQFIGPIGLVSNFQLTTSNQCENLTENHLNEFSHRWSTCQSSCSNEQFQKYLTYIKTNSLIKFYLSIGNDSNNLLNFYERILSEQFPDSIQLKSLYFNIEHEEILLKQLFMKNILLIYSTIIIYCFCLLIFVKSFFLIFIVFLHFFFALSLTLITYIYLFHFPLTILNLTSSSLALYLMIFDAFVWYSCWFNSHHRRDDCTVQRIIENLITQTFFYLIPKNLAAIIILVITYTNQIIALQCFTIGMFFFISISFLISFILYPVSFIFILRYQSFIPTIECISFRFLASTTNCFIDRTVPYLIARWKVFWLIFFSILSCFSLIIIFQWPKLQIDICHLTFDTIPSRLTNYHDEQCSKTFDIDITYYLGSNWDVPIESFIPLRDYPKLDYIREDQISTHLDESQTFPYIFQRNLSRIIEFCQTMKDFMSTKSMNSSNDYRLTLKSFSCFSDFSPIIPMNISEISSKFASYIHVQKNQTHNCSIVCSNNQTDISRYECMICLNSIYFYRKQFDDLFLIKNGLRFPIDLSNPRYLFQTVQYQWRIQTNINNYLEWKYLVEYLKDNYLTKFFGKFASSMSFWYTSEIFSTFTIFEQLQQDIYFLLIIKFTLILIFLIISTGVLGIFVTLTTLVNYSTCLAILVLFNYHLTIENLSYFILVLIINLQYSVLYSISYKLSPTFFFQHQNRTMYSLKQMCTTLFYLTLAISFLSIPCLLSSLIYLYKLAFVYMISSLISFFYSTFFLQSLFCFIGPNEHSCLSIPWRLTLTRKVPQHSKQTNDSSMRNSTKTLNTRRHHRMSTSSYFASSYFSQIFTGSTYFESEYGGLNDSRTSASRRRESSRSHQLAHNIKRSSLLTGELIELYAPRASLAPHVHHRYSRQSSVSRGLQTSGPARPLYISPSISPFSQLSIHSQTFGRPHTPSPHTFRPSRSPSPRSLALTTTTTTTTTAAITSTDALRPCSSAPRLHAPLHRATTWNIKTSETLFEETTHAPTVLSTKKIALTIQRQNAVISTNELERISTVKNTELPAAKRRSILKATAIEAGDLVWLKRSNSS